MATSFNLPTLQGPLLHKSHFLGQTQFINLTHTHTHTHTHKSSKQSSHQIINPSAKFNLYEILGGRGLLNGEEGVQQELKKPPPEISPTPPTTTTAADQEDLATPSVPEDGFEKELLGLTGGFPGGEKGLRDFIEKNPPPKKPPPPPPSSTTAGFNGSLIRKPKAPELPLLMPGMIAIVKNPNSPYHMYCGIVQRITDGKAGVLFEGGNWDRLITFKLDELERREKGPPMVSPRSVLLDDLVEKST